MRALRRVVAGATRALSSDYYAEYYARLEVSVAGTNFSDTLTHGKAPSRVTADRSRQLLTPISAALAAAGLRPASVATSPSSAAAHASPACTSCCAGNSEVSGSYLAGVLSQSLGRHRVRRGDAGRLVLRAALRLAVTTGSAVSALSPISRNSRRSRSACGPAGSVATYLIPRNARADEEGRDLHDHSGRPDGRAYRGAAGRAAKCTGAYKRSTMATAAARNQGNRIPATGESWGAIVAAAAAEPAAAAAAAAAVRMHESLPRPPCCCTARARRGANRGALIYRQHDSPQHMAGQCCPGWA